MPYSENKIPTDIYDKMFAIERIQAFVEGEVVANGGLNQDSLPLIIDAIYNRSVRIFPNHIEEYHAFCEELKNKKFDNETDLITVLSQELAAFAKEHIEAKVLEADMGRAMLERHNFTQVNYMISYGVDDSELHLHVAPAYSKTGREKITLVETGFKALAEKLKNDPNLKDVKIISATSWIVAKEPLLMKRFGFTVLGDIDEDLRKKHFADEQRDVNRAVIKVDDFINKWG